MSEEQERSEEQVISDEKEQERSVATTLMGLLRSTTNSPRGSHRASPETIVSADQISNNLANIKQDPSKIHSSPTTNTLQVPSEAKSKSEVNATATNAESAKRLKHESKVGHLGSKLKTKAFVQVSNELKRKSLKADATDTESVKRFKHESKVGHLGSKLEAKSISRQPFKSGASQSPSAQMQNLIDRSNAVKVSTTPNANTNFNVNSSVVADVKHSRPQASSQQKPFPTTSSQSSLSSPTHVAAQLMSNSNNNNNSNKNNSNNNNNNNNKADTDDEDIVINTSAYAASKRLRSDPSMTSTMSVESVPMSTHSTGLYPQQQMMMNRGANELRAMQAMKMQPQQQQQLLLLQQQQQQQQQQQSMMSPEMYQQLMYQMQYRQQHQHQQQHPQQQQQPSDQKGNQALWVMRGKDGQPQSQPQQPSMYAHPQQQQTTTVSSSSWPPQSFHMGPQPVQGLTMEQAWQMQQMHAAGYGGQPVFGGGGQQHPSMMRNAYHPGMQYVYNMVPMSMSSSNSPIQQPIKPKTQEKAVKACICCARTNTPLWRDIAAGRPLCNACGIRWNKYGILCGSCNYVPCKQERQFLYCVRCQSQMPPPVKNRRGMKKRDNKPIVST